MRGIPWLVWNGILQYPKLFVPLSQILFLETARSHSEPYKGNRMGVPFQQPIFGPETAWQKAPCKLEHCHGEEANLGPNFRPFSTYSFTIQLQYLHIISLVDCLALWNEFKVNRTRDIEEGDKYCHYLWFRHASFLGSWGCRLFPL